MFKPVGRRSATVHSVPRQPPECQPGKLDVLPKYTLRGGIVRASTPMLHGAQKRTETW
jgi:hypothetical protein